MIGEYTKTRQAEIAENLATDTKFATVHRLRTHADTLSAREIRRIHIVTRSANLLQTREEILAGTLRAEIDNRASARRTNRAHRCAKIITRTLRAATISDPKNVTE